MGVIFSFSMMKKMILDIEFIGDYFCAGKNREND